MAKALVRTPGWPSQAEHRSGGCRKQLGKAENLQEVVTAPELSHSQTRWRWDLNSSAELWSQGAAESSLRWDEEDRPQPRAVCTPQVTAGAWGSPVNSSFPSPTCPEAPQHWGLTVKQPDLATQNCFQGQMLSSSATREWKLGYNGHRTAKVFPLLRPCEIP